MSDTTTSCGNQGILPMEDGFAGCSYSGFEIDVSEEDSQTTLTDVVMTVNTKPDFSGTTALTLSAGSGLTIIDAGPPWKVGIDDIEELDLAAGTYYFDMKFIDAAPMKEPLLRGTWRIQPTA